MCGDVEQSVGGNLCSFFCSVCSNKGKSKFSSCSLYSSFISALTLTLFNMTRCYLCWSIFTVQRHQHCWSGNQGVQWTAVGRAEAQNSRAEQNSSRSLRPWTQPSQTQLRSSPDHSAHPLLEVLEMVGAEFESAAVHCSSRKWPCLTIRLLQCIEEFTRASHTAPARGWPEHGFSLITACRFTSACDGANKQPERIAISSITSVYSGHQRTLSIRRSSAV